MSKEFSVLNFSENDYPATDLVKELVQQSGSYASQLNRNTFFNLVVRATDIYNSINDLIRVVENEDDDSWDNYDRYNAALDLLEVFIVQLFRSFTHSS